VTDNMKDALAAVFARVSDLGALADANAWPEVADVLDYVKIKLVIAQQMVEKRAVPGSEGRRGDFIGTFTGRRFWPLDPRAEEVDPRDIAHALSLKCRWTGHCSRLYTVAEHSLRVAAIVRAGLAVAPEWGPLADLPPGADPVPYALLHDAAEAYLADVARPVKRFLFEWSEIEARVDAAILDAFKLTPPSPEVAAVVAWADDVALVLEAQALFRYDVHAAWPGLPMLNAPAAVLAAPGVAVPEYALGAAVFSDMLRVMLLAILDAPARPERALAAAKDKLAESFGGPRSWQREVAEGKVADPEAEMRRRGLLD